MWAAEITKGFEINDLGYTNTQERLDGGARLSYREIVPGKLFRSYNVSLSSFFNFSHDVLDDLWSSAAWTRARTGGNYSLNTDLQLVNYWHVRGNFSLQQQRMSRTATRGGPLMIQPGRVSSGLDLNTDGRKVVSYGLHLDYNRDTRGDGGQTHIGVDLNIRPSARLQVSFRPNLSRDRSSSQYVTSTDVLPFSATYGQRYVFSDLERRTFSMETRVDWTFTPRLSLQLFAQPLLSSGDYVTYKQLAAPESYDFQVYRPGTAVSAAGGVRCLSGSICELDGVQYVDLNGDGASDFSFDDRDFNVRSLVGNAVLRWEYRPGSTVFLVWQRRQSDQVNVGNFDLSRDARALFRAPSDDRFILKVNYWLGL